MPDEKGNELADQDKIPPTPLHAHDEDRDEDIEGHVPDGEEGAEDVEKTGGGTTGRPGGRRVTGEDSEVSEGGPQGQVPTKVSAVRRPRPAMGSCTRSPRGCTSCRRRQRPAGPGGALEAAGYFLTP